MKKILGLIVVLVVSVVLGRLFMEYKGIGLQDMPESYQVMENLESQGLYSGQDHTIQTLEGASVNLSSLKGKVVILSFWATWCEPCIEEFPSFVKLVDAFPEKVVLVAISQDYQAEDVKKFVKAFQGFRENVLLTLDEEKVLSRSFAVDRLPEAFVFNQEGKLVKKVLGIQDWASDSALEFFKRL